MYFFWKLPERQRSSVFFPQAKEVFSETPSAIAAYPLTTFGAQAFQKKAS